MKTFMCARNSGPITDRVPGVRIARAFGRALKNSRNIFLRNSPPGHFYSPIPDLDYVKENSAKIFSRNVDSCPGINLNIEKQISLIKAFAGYYENIPFPEDNAADYRYYFQNDFFGAGSSIILYSMMRHFEPKQIIEVGSGFSSAAMLDVNDAFFGGEISMNFIEPFPERLLSLLRKEDSERHLIIEEIVQDVPIDLFRRLKEKDFLFLDSSHVAKVGSDVVHLLTEVLPILQTGVIVHVHDIYWPFEYPEEWIFSGRAWNEAYLLKAFLQFNSSFEILVFNSYLALHHQGLMERCLPRFLPGGGSSLWMRKKA
jgi:predicted O-methyltransferase YrrM